MANILKNTLKNTKLRALFTGVIVGAFFFVSSVLGFGFELPAQAATLTPEAHSYKVDTIDNDNDLINNSQNKLSELADNVREKLNLDEELPVSTKKFFNQVEDVVTGDSSSKELPSQKPGAIDDGNHNFINAK